MCVALVGCRSGSSLYIYRVYLLTYLLSSARSFAETHNPHSLTQKKRESLLPSSVSLCLLRTVITVQEELSLFCSWFRSAHRASE